MHLCSVRITTAFVPKVESAERLDVAKVELGEHRVKNLFLRVYFYIWSSFVNPMILHYSQKETP